MAKGKETGLYEPRREHDGCGISAVVNISGKREHSIIEYGRQVLLNLHHRGAAGADEAISDCSKALEINPQYAQACYNRAISYQKKDQYDLAISDFTRALESNPNDSPVYSSRAAAYGAKGEYDRAISDYTKVIELNPMSAKAYGKRAFAYYLTGKYDEAWEDVYKAQNLGLQVSPEFLKDLREASSPTVSYDITEFEDEYKSAD